MSQVVKPAAVYHGALLYRRFYFFKFYSCHLFAYLRWFHFICNIECPTRYRTRHFFNNFTTNEQFGTLQTHTTDTFLFISHTTNVLLFKFRCNIFIGVRIIKEMPGLVASGTHCIFLWYRDVYFCYVVYTTPVISCIGPMAFPFVVIQGYFRSVGDI